MKIKRCASGWETWLDQYAIKKNGHRKIFIEGGTLMGGLLAEGIPVDSTHQQ
ncbi:MAG: hypothetical protein ACXWT1_21485 [Methylobacter sp.]